MRKLENCNNLYTMYRRSFRGVKISFFIFLVLFLLSFATFFTDFPFDLTMIMMLMIIPAIGMGIIWLILRGRTAKLLAQFSSPELEQINNEIPMHQMLEGFVVTRHALINSKGTLMLFPIRNLLWIYKYEQTFSYYGIRVGKTSCLMVAGRDKKRYACNIKNKSKAIDFIQAELSKYRTDIIYGYDDELETMFKKDINRMIALSKDFGSRQQGL